MSKRLGNWLLHGEHGISSMAIAGVLMGGTVTKGQGGWWHPSDPDDLRRCLTLLEAVPEWRGRIGEMASVSKEWAALAAHWDELAALLEEEVPGWRTRTPGMAPKTYARMRELIKGARQ